MNLSASEKGPQSITDEEEIIPFVLWVYVQNGRTCVYSSILAALFAVFEDPDDVGGLQML